MTPSTAAPKYYVARHRVGWGLVVIFPLVGGGLAALAGVAYAFACGLITQVFESPPLFVVATPLFATALLWAGRAVCNLGEVRWAAVRLPIGLAVGALGYYFSWHAYLNLLDTVHFEPPVSWTMSPARVFHAMGQRISMEGGWTVVGWLLEFATIEAVIAFMQQTDDDPPSPYCERCRSWTRLAFHFDLADGTAQIAKQHLERGEAAALGDLKARPRSSSSWVLVRVHDCTCGASRYVSIHRAEIKRGRNASMVHSPIGGHAHIEFNPGSPDETRLSPVVVDLVIDEATERTLDEVRSTLSGHR